VTALCHQSRAWRPDQNVARAAQQFETAKEMPASATISWGQKRLKEFCLEFEVGFNDTEPG
jgi:hypothetical protein